MAAQLHRLRRHADGVRIGDADAVHDMRVATRRLRADYALFARWYNRAERGGLKRGLRRLDRRLGSLRDADVMLGETHSVAASLPATDLNRVLAHLQAQRASARADLLTYLESGRYRTWRARFARFLDQHDGRTGEARLGWTRAKRVSRSQVLPSRVCDVLPAEIWVRYGRVRAYESSIGGASPGRLHSLRIDARRLRYAVEAFRELLGEPGSSVLHNLRELQNALGTLHDSQVLVDLLMRLARDAGPDNRMGSYISQERGRAVEARADFERVWPAITGGAFRATLSRAVAQL